MRAGECAGASPVLGTTNLPCNSQIAESNEKAEPPKPNLRLGIVLYLGSRARAVPTPPERGDMAREREWPQSWQLRDRIELRQIRGDGRAG